MLRWADRLSVDVRRFRELARERLRQRYLDLLGLLCDDAVERDDLLGAIGYARDLVDHDPMDAEAYVRLARLQLEAVSAGTDRFVRPVTRW